MAFKFVICQTNVFSAENDVLLRRLEAMEEKIGRDIAELRRENAELKHDVKELAGLKSNIEELRQENAGLKHDIKELSDKMDKNARAVLGVRFRVFLLSFFTLMFGHYRIKSRSMRFIGRVLLDVGSPSSGCHMWTQGLSTVGDDASGYQ